MSTKRYGVWSKLEIAIGHLPYHEKYEDAMGERELLADPKFSIWDYTTTPPTDVTTADPELVGMAMKWSKSEGFCTWPYRNAAPELSMELRNSKLFYAFAHKHFPQEYTPTIHDLNDALTPYNVQVPMPEEPQWWICYNKNDGWGEWTLSEFYDHKNGSIWYGLGGFRQCRVYGVSSELNEKRDLLIEASRKAGEPS